MVEIIESKPDPSVVKKVICKNCGVTLQYIPKEVLKQELRSYGEYDGEYHYIVCPTCRERVKVPKPKID